MSRRPLSRYNTIHIGRVSYIWYVDMWEIVCNFYMNMSISDNNMLTFTCELNHTL